MKLLLLMMLLKGILLIWHRSVDERTNVCCWSGSFGQRFDFFLALYYRRVHIINRHKRRDVMLIHPWPSSRRHIVCCSMKAPSSRWGPRCLLVGSLLDLPCVRPDDTRTCWPLRRRGGGYGNGGEGSLQTAAISIMQSHVVHDFREVVGERGEGQAAPRMASVTTRRASLRIAHCGLWIDFDMMPLGTRGEKWRERKRRGQREEIEGECLPESQDRTGQAPSGLARWRST